VIAQAGLKPMLRRAPATNAFCFGKSVGQDRFHFQIRNAEFRHAIFMGPIRTGSFF
jgi:hypothetical protein